MSFYLVAKMVKLGVNDEGILVRRASLVEFNEAVASAAVRKPVPVVFGTRMISPVVTAWGGRHRYQTQLTLPRPRYWIPGGRSGITTNPSPPLDQWQVLWEMSMRMVLCVGPIEPIRRFFVDDIEIHPWTVPSSAVTPYFGIGARPTTRPDPQSYIRYFSTPEDLQLFGGLQGGGGIGFLIAAESVSFAYQFGAEFLLCLGNDRATSYSPLSLRQEIGAPTRGCSSLLFYDFNFGSSLPPKKWRVQVKRYRQQTNYTPQWYPERVALSTVETVANQYFLIAYPQWWYAGSRDEECTGWSATRFTHYYNTIFAFLERLGAMYRANPRGFGGTVTVELLPVPMTWYGTFANSDWRARRPLALRRIGGQLAGSVTRSSSLTVTINSPVNDVERLKDFVRATARSNDSTARSYRIRWLNWYVQNIRERWNIRRAIQNRERRVEQSTIIAWWGGLQTFGRNDRFKFSYSLDTSKRDVTTPIEFLSDWRTEAIADMNRVAESSGYGGESPIIRWLAGSTEAVASSFATNQGFGTPDSPRFPNIYVGRCANYPTQIANILDFSGYGTWYRLYRRDDEVLERLVRETTSSVVTMNPVHALREALIDKDWGSGIDESALDDLSFRAAALTCYNERLDFCYIWDSLNPPDRLISSILDYIDGVLYYEPNQGHYRLKLIRRDYNIAAIPLFNRTNISDISNFKRQNADQIINSLTVSFFDAVRDTRDSLTIHDLRRSREVGRTISAKIDYPGCATVAAAQRVAARELFGLSQALISFVISVDNADGIGIGDAVRVEWKDLDIGLIIMRVLSIDYSDGRQTMAAGVKLALVQDVFANVFDYGSLQGPNPDFVEPANPLPDLGSTLLIESGFTDRPTKPTDAVYETEQDTSLTNPSGVAWWSIGVGEADPIPSDPVTVTAVEENLAVKTAVAGRLVFPIGNLVDTPFNQQSLVIYVDDYGSGITLPAFGDVIRIDDELFVVQKATRQFSSGRFSRLEIDLNQRGYYDTTSVSHAAGATVVFWSRMAQFKDVWDGTPYTIYAVATSGIRQRHTETPSTPIARSVRPPCPTEITINGVYDYESTVYGDIEVTWSVRSREGQVGPADRNLTTWISLLYRGTLMLAHSVLYGTATVTSGNFARMTLSATEISNAISADAGAIEIHLSSTAVQGRVESWQTAKYLVNWRRTGTCAGWDCDWGNDWGGPTAGGFGIDFGQDYGQGA